MLSTHAAHDFGSSACPVRKVLTYYPFLINGDFKTQATLPLTSTRDKDEPAQSHLLICCTTHVAAGTGNKEEMYDCLSEFEMHEIEAEESSTEDDCAAAPTYAPTTQVTSRKKRDAPSKQARMQEAVPRGQSRARTTNTPIPKLSRLGVWGTLSFLVFLHSVGQFAKMQPAPLPPKGSTETLEHVLRAQNLGLCMMTIKGTLPDGTSTMPMSDSMVKDPELGGIWGNHAALTEADKESLRKLVLLCKYSAFAYAVHDLGTYNGDVGPFSINLQHDEPLIAKRWAKSRLEAEFQAEKCIELRDVGLIEPAPADCKCAS